MLLLDAICPAYEWPGGVAAGLQLDPDLICIITGYATAELAMQATREGVHDFIAVDVLRQNMK